MKPNLNTDTLRKNKYRYLSFVIGFLLLVAPFAILVRIVYALQAIPADPTLHSVCYRMTIEWMFTGRYWFTILTQNIYLVSLVALIVAFFFGPIFCGWICPIASVTETLSRIVPKKLKIDVRNKVNLSMVRYGFLVGFLVPGILGLIGPSTPFVGGCCAPGTRSLAETLGVGSICCRFCAASTLQNVVDAATGSLSSVVYWHSGSIVTLFFWFFVGGIFLQGGRGWCWVCPLGVLSNLLHRIGAGLKVSSKIKHDPSKCVNCGKCQEVCPTWAIKNSENKITIDKHTCVVCKECVHSCKQAALQYGRG